VSYGDYVEQLTDLLFLKMVDEQEKIVKKQTSIPKGLDWSSLINKDGDGLENHYRHSLMSLGKESQI